jgi:PHD/YefM family antitoxin component YafN of YafNO toxin-antitoxin module
VLIAAKRSSAVLVAEEDWKAIQETMHLRSIPGRFVSRWPSRLPRVRRDRDGEADLLDILRDDPFGNAPPFERSSAT